MPRPTYQEIYDHLPIGVQQVVVRASGWYSHRIRFGTAFEEARRELERSDFWSADQISDYQSQRVRATIRWAAKTVPYYRELFRREGIDLDSIRSPADLKAIPPLTKEIVRDNLNQFISEAIPRRKLIPTNTSGTTGTALTVYRTREALSQEYAAAWRQRSWFGIYPGASFAAFGGQAVVPLQQRKPPFWRGDPARSRVLFSLYHMSEEFLDHYAREFIESRYTFWQGYPSSIGLLCEYLDGKGIDLGDAVPMAVFTSSESLLDFHREEITKITRAQIGDRYGNTELSVSVAQCAAGSYHIDSEVCAIEIDPHEETDEWVRGEVISTGFANGAMPFIRYRTGDVATLLKDSNCACGRNRPILKRIDGRVEDYIVTPEGRRIGRMDYIFKNSHAVKEAQICQKSVNRILVRVVARPEFGAAAQRRLDREFRMRLGDQIQIDYEQVTSIPRAANGKFRLVISELDAGKLRGAEDFTSSAHFADVQTSTERRSPVAIAPKRAVTGRGASLSLQPENVGAGRMLHVQPDGTLYICRQHEIYRSTDDAATWQHIFTMPHRTPLRIAQVSRLASRLLRNEVRTMEVLSDGRLIAANRDTVFTASEQRGDSMQRSRIDENSRPAAPPMRFCVDADDRVLWGEYLANSQRQEVRLYISEDRGDSYEVAHVFDAGSIRHVHSVTYDKHLDHYWVFTGDYGKEAGIGRLSKDLKDFDWLARGSQQYRAVCSFDVGDSLIYGTDTELEPNWILRMDKQSGRTERLAHIEGSCMYACRFGGIHALTTTVEPSKVNTARVAALWTSRDGDHWQRGFEARKDAWSGKYFQYGSLVLPSGGSDREVVAFSGQALHRIEGLSFVVREEDDPESEDSSEKSGVALALEG